MSLPHALPESVINRLEDMAGLRAEMEAQLGDPDLISNHQKVRDLSIRKAALDAPVAAFQDWRRACTELEDLQEAATGPDEELKAIAAEELPQARQRAASCAESVKRTLVNNEDLTIGSVILEIRAGTGGDEAGLWARDLLTMYHRHAQTRRWTWEELEATTDASVGGVRHAVIGLRGEGVWNEMAFEAGVHSVKRVPATETQGRIHTSTATVAVLPEPEAVDVKIDWARDVQEHVTTAQGPGGQNVNKVATAVHMIHTPTGVEVRMQESKSQAQNREKARRLLMARVAEIERIKIEAERTADRNAQIGSGGRSEKIRVYRYQDDITADQRLDSKFKTSTLISGDLGPLFEALREQETERRLASL